MVRTPPRPTLTPRDWIDAALAAMAAAGPDAVAVDRLAKQLGASRGSFYWHFTDRADLLRAALEQWERRDTEDVIAHLRDLPDARARLALLLEHTLTAAVDPLEVALVAAAQHPVVAPVLRRVVIRRLDALQRIFSDLGLGPEEARERSWTAYTSYVGHHQLLRGGLAEPPPGLDRMLALLLSPPLG
ncbi:AcrR family transcriptional regulator [Kineococcus xinjiangensis]|uniref:AcrR family transcriptional regulator n=1 Tax=Kineococcus xinjiangensis TaxID=512762 RepID=A0A2S6IIW8_9ACTN|nr:TetR/AcrR family transcriptional regulator [Kineococcus xinjiangensis]PPK94125.1 AcrR family transcriptional regulator [Kineococcus xinjiangensis]